MLHIAITADPELPVPPILYGGIERIIDMLARGLVSRGHDVTVFANRESATAGRLIPWPGRASRSRVDTIRNAGTLMRHVLAGRFDLVHSFSRVAYLLPLLSASIPKLMTYQRDISLRSVKLGHILSHGTLWFSAISDQMMRDVSSIGTWRLVPNGVPIAAYNFVRNVGNDAPLVFLGRVEALKGPHLAIEIAHRANIPLVIAGNIPEEHRAWFNLMIAPHIDGKRVTYVGPVDDTAKNALLGRARALLMPILWEEPFGIVMAEAMACGTPVLGFGRGAVPEVVEHSVTGFVAQDLDGLVAAAANIDHIDRAACRARVELLFSDAAIVDAYLAIYAEMVASRLVRTR